MDNQVLFSICIPTYKRPEILRQLLVSIEGQGVDHSLYDVCITDNSDTDETERLIQEEFSHVDNLRYKKVECQGFMNSVEALKLGDGKFLKLHNDYTILEQGALQAWIDLVGQYETERPEIFFLLNSLPTKSEIEVCPSYDSFMNTIQIWATWSSGFAIWKDDFDQLYNSGLEIDSMYPHTSFLFELGDKTKYVVDNRPLTHNMELKSKGGYNLIDNFVRIFLNMVRKQLLERDWITMSTFDMLQRRILQFCVGWYCEQQKDDRYHFSYDNAEDIIKQTCGEKGWKIYQRYLVVYKLKYFLVKVKHTIFR